MRRIFGVLSIALVALIAMALISPDTDAPLVRTELVGIRSLHTTAVGTGRLDASASVDVESEVPGRVSHVYVREGDEVRAGDPLLQIDPSRHDVAIARATAALAQAQAASEQVKANLLMAQTGKRRAENIAQSSGLVASVELEQTATQVAALEAQHRASGHAVDQARAVLDEATEMRRRTMIRAPISGTVTHVRIHPGEMAGAGGVGPVSSLVSIADLASLEVRVSVSEVDMPRISVGDSVSVRVDALPNARFSGRVTRVSPASTGRTAGRQSTMFEVGVTLNRPSRHLRPDLSATAEIIIARRDAAISVPLLALVIRDSTGRRRRAHAATLGKSAAVTWQGTEGVFVVHGDSTRFQPVRAGILGDQYIEIVSGLSGGERVVVGPYQTLRQLDAGSAVTVESSAAERREP